MATSIPSLASLLKRADIEDHDEVLSASNAELKKSKGDLGAQHAKVVALLKLDRYEDAVKALEHGGAKLEEKARLEHAYALYKSGRPSEAAEIAQDVGERGYQHVEAQARYRMEDFQRSAELYQELLAGSDGDDEADLRVNGGAIDAQLEWSGRGELVKKKKPGREDLEAFETAYNAACGSIARGELGQGEVLLTRARDLCNALEDLSEDDKRAELLPITVQQIYVLAKLGRVEEADNLAKRIDAQSISDPSTRHIAHVNSIATQESSSNSFLAQRLVSRDPDTLKPDNPFTFQSTILKADRYAADLQALKFSGIASSTATAISKQTSSNLDSYYNSLSVINAAAHARSATGKEALKHIIPLLQKRPNDVGLILTIVQLYVLTGNSASAINLLESFLNRLEQSETAAELDVRFAPGLVGALVSLYHSQSRRGHVQKELAKAATHWRRKSKDRSLGVTHLFKAAGAALIDSNESEHQNLAAEIFTDLHDQDPEDRYAAAGLLASAPNTASSSELTSNLTPVDRLTSSIDVSALESVGIAQVHSSATATATTRKRPADDTATKPKKTKRIRKSRMPKDYDPNKKLDPERWLPLRDRSSYRPKGKKGKARANLLSQGAAPSGAESEGSRPGTPGGQVVTGKQSGGAGKKKGKGRK